VGEPDRLPLERPRLLVTDAPVSHRYEARLEADGPLAALISYERSETWLRLLHTEVQPGFEGRGISSELVARVIDDIRSRGLTVIPQCPFVVRWLERHPEQQDVLSHPLPGHDPSPPSEPPEPA
jgi:predicted GNAT family acetyltransferase